MSVLRSITEFSEVRFEGPERLVERWRLRLEYRL
jgi:hypothetical protein